MPTNNEPTTAGDLIGQLAELWSHLLAAPFVVFFLIAVILGGIACGRR